MLQSCFVHHDAKTPTGHMRRQCAYMSSLLPGAVGVELEIKHNGATRAAAMIIHHCSSIYSSFLASRPYIRWSPSLCSNDHALLQQHILFISGNLIIKFDGHHHCHPASALSPPPPFTSPTGKRCMYAVQVEPSCQHHISHLAGVCCSDLHPPHRVPSHRGESQLCCSSCRGRLSGRHSGVGAVSTSLVHRAKG